MRQGSDLLNLSLGMSVCHRALYNRTLVFSLGSWMSISAAPHRLRRGMSFSQVLWGTSLLETREQLSNPVVKARHG